MTCRYRFIIMGANTRRQTSMLSLMEFNDSIRVLSLLYCLSSKQNLHHNAHYLEKPNLHFGLDFHQVFNSQHVLLSFNNHL